VNDFLEMASKVGEAEALRIYQLCQIDHLLTRKTDQLSGGERQRTALARLLTTSPRLLLLDEPYSNLDGIHKQVLKDVISRIVEDGTSCIMVSHDPNDVLPWAEEIMVLKEGKVIQKDSPAQVYRRPVNAYVAGLFGDYNLLSASQARSIAGIDTKPGAESFFVRPEKIGLQPASDGTETGTVAAVLFFGGYYELEVDVAGTTLLVKTTHEGYQKGDVVSLEIRPNDLWAF
jgi:iron(III) transport system ATP-binding protein